MSSNFAIIENNSVINVIVADSEEIAKLIYPNAEIVDTEVTSIGMFWFKDNNKWYPPKPEGTYVWNEDAQNWLTPEANQEYIAWVIEHQKPPIEQEPA
jgi:mannitol-1-phosphate/altronate dehydrogenase